MYPQPFRRARRHITLSVATLAVTALLVAGCGDNQSASDTDAIEAPSTSAPPAPADTNPEVATIAVAFADGRITDGGRRQTVHLGQAVHLEVRGDANDEVHVHTYDLHADVAPGSPAVIDFVAQIPGVHEVELEGAGLRLLQLQVEP